MDADTATGMQLLQREAARVFVNPNAAEVLTELSAAVRALLDDKESPT